MPVRSITSEEELVGVAEEILKALPSHKPSAHLVLLSGELGVGKTALVKALAKVLGVAEHVTSPTFVLMKSYSANGHAWVKELVHIDAYRMDDQREAKVLGLDALTKKEGSIICIEWPERIKEAIPEDALTVGITAHEDGRRTITYGT